MGFWSSIKRGLGIGPPRSIDNRRLRKRNRSGSFSSGQDSGFSFISSETEGGTTHLANSVVYPPESSARPEDIIVVDEEAELENRGRPKKRIFRRLSKKKKTVKGNAPLPSTSELMKGAAPAPSISTVDDAVRERIKEAMNISPRPGSVAGSLALSQQSRPPSVAATAKQTPPISGGLLSNITQSPAKAPTPPLARQTPRLSLADARSVTSRATSSRRPTSRRISVREVTDTNGDAPDTASMAALSYATRTPKVTRIYEVAEVINPGERPLSAVTEESIGYDKPYSPPVSRVNVPAEAIAGIDRWFEGHRVKLDSIDVKLQALKAEILEQKNRRRYFTA